MGFFSSFLDFLFPKRCVGCGRFGKYLCDSCRKEQKLHFPQICPVCEKPAVDGRTHPGCKTPLSLDGAIFIFSYSPPISQLLKQFKYRLGRDLLTTLVSLTVGELKNVSFSSSTILIPIPLYPLRSNWRGFNQSALLGKEIAKGLGWEYNPDILVRTKFRKPQTEVKKVKKRRLNVQGIFKVLPNSPIAQQPNYLIFDDVWTTGATMKEAAKVLKRKGARFVWALAIAR